MKRPILSAAIAVMAVLPSCDKNYDLSKIDKTVAVAKNLDVPIINPVDVKVSKIIKLTDDSLIKVDKDSNYLFLTKTSLRKVDICVDKFTVPRTDLNTSDIEIKVPPIPQKPDEDVKLTLISEPNSIEININDLPGEILNARKLNGDFKFIFHFDVCPMANISKFYLSKEKFGIEYPSWVIIESCTDPRFVVNADNKITLNENVPVETGKPFEINLNISGIDISKFDGVKNKFIPGTPGKKDGILQINDYMKISDKSEVFVKPEDMETSATETTCKIVTSSYTTEFTITSAEVKLQPDLSGLNLDPVQIKPGDFPEFLTKDGTIVDMAGDFNLEIYMKNPSPLGMELNTKISTLSYKTRVPEEIDKVSMKFGKDYGEEQIYFESDYEGTIKVSKNIKDTEDSRSLFYRVPYQIMAEEYSVRPDDKFVSVELGKKYEIEFQCFFTTPFIVDKELNVFYDNYQMKDLKLNIPNNLNVTKSSLVAEAVNTIPFTLQIKSAKALDKDMKVIEGIRVTTDLVVSPGSFTSPSRTPISVFLETDSSTGLSALSAISFDAQIADGDKNYQLNARQGVQFDNAAMHLDNGIEYKL